MKLRSIIAACSIGNFLEWYDYALFGFLSSTIGVVFFPQTSHVNLALVNSFLVFAVGFFMRPLGSILFGLIGDRIGRKLALVFSILFVTIPTLCMGILPTYVQIGVWAAVILALLRIVQGIPVGGEVGGIMCYLVEIAPPNQKCFFGGWTFVGAQFGFVVSSLEIYAFETWMNPGAFMEWGWRFSFILGGLLGLFGWYLRRKLHETPDFRYALNHHQILKSPFSSLIKNHKKEFFQAFCFSALPAAGFYVAFYFFAIYFSEILQMNMKESLLINALMLTLSCIAMPLFGKLGDRYGIKKPMIYSTLAVIVISYLTCYCAAQKLLGWTLFFQIILALVMSVSFALIPALLSKIFPTPVRFTGVGIAYNLSNALLGGPAPLISLYLVKWTGSQIAPAYYLIGLALLTLVPFLFKDSVLKEIE